jgi:hypothetical protein
MTSFAVLWLRITLLTVWFYSRGGARAGKTIPIL